MCCVVTYPTPSFLWSMLFNYLSPYSNHDVHRYTKIIWCIFFITVKWYCESLHNSGITFKNIWNEEDLNEKLSLCLQTLQTYWMIWATTLLVVAMCRPACCWILDVLELPKSLEHILDFTCIEGYFPWHRTV